MHMPQTIGEQLKQAREARGLSLEQAAQVTRVRLHYLEALENDLRGQLPSAVQGRGFLRLYADYLGLPAQPLLDQWEGRVPPEPAAQPDEPASLEAAPVAAPSAVENTDDAKESVEEDADEIVIAEPELDEEMPEAEEIIQISPRVEKPGAPPMVQSQAILKEIGAELRQRRESISLSLSDIEHYTRLRQHYLRALEEGRIDDLPSAVQGRGMLSNYAEFLNLDVDALLGRFADALQARRLELQPAAQQRASRPVASRPLHAAVDQAERQNDRKRPATFDGRGETIGRLISPDLLIVGSLIILLVVFVIWAASRVTTLSNAGVEPTARPISEVLLETGEPSITPTFEPTQTTPIPPGLVNPSTSGSEAATEDGNLPPASNSPVQVYVVAHQRAWLRVRVDGGEAFSGRVIPGNAYPFSGTDKIELLTGNAAALQVFYNQVDLGTLGSTGQVVSLIFLPDTMITPTPAFTATPSPTLPPTATLQPTATLPSPTVTPFVP